MKHPLFLAGRFLATAMFTAIGLGVYGCGDSATVNPPVELSSLSVTTGPTTAALQPPFSRTTTDYTVLLSSDVMSVTVSARPAIDGDSVSINGQATTNRAIDLEPAGQTTVVHIVVSESNTNSRTYTVKVVRAGLDENNSLRGLSVSPGTLTPAFTKNEQFYRVDDVNSTIDRVTVTPTLDDPNATMTVNGQDTPSDEGREITLKPAGEITIIEIFVKAQNGQVKQYHVEVPRGTSGNNDLRNLTVSPGSLDSAFNKQDQSYTVNVASTVSSIRVTPTLDDPTATLTVTSNGQVTTSGQTRTITLRDAGLSTTITIQVTAQNGSQKPYTIIVDRAAPPPPSGNNNLQSLTVSPGTLSPAFDAARTRTDYAVNDVSSSATSILVTATPQDSSATVEIDKQAGNSRSILLPTGPSLTEIEVRVIAPNGTDKTYFITVTQPEPAAPAAPAAPILHPDSDSGISQTDNITNILTPSFIVPQPAAGETASLYVGIDTNPGEKVATSFDPATNTLTMTNPLLPGEYDITVTSTVTNAAGLESPQSQPPLTVHIDNVPPGSPIP